MALTAVDVVPQPLIQPVEVRQPEGAGQRCRQSHLSGDERLTDAAGHHFRGLSGTQTHRFEGIDHAQHRAEEPEQRRRNHESGENVERVVVEGDLAIATLLECLLEREARSHAREHMPRQTRDGARQRCQPLVKVTVAGIPAQP